MDYTRGFPRFLSLPIELRRRIYFFLLRRPIFSHSQTDAACGFGPALTPYRLRFAIEETAASKRPHHGKVYEYEGAEQYGPVLNTAIFTTSRAVSREALAVFYHENTFRLILPTKSEERKATVLLPTPRQLEMISRLQINFNFAYRSSYNLTPGSYCWRVIEALAKKDDTSHRQCLMDIYRSPYSELFNIDTPFFNLLASLTSHKEFTIQIWSRAHTGGRISKKILDRYEGRHSGSTVYFDEEETEDVDRQLPLRFKALLDPHLGTSEVTQMDVNMYAVDGNGIVQRYTIRINALTRLVWRPAEALAAGRS